MLLHLLQSRRFTSPRSTLHKSYVFCAMLQFCYLFYTTFSLSPFSLFIECCTKYIVAISQCISFNKHIENCNIAHTVCIRCNLLRTGRFGKLKSLYKIHSKIAILYRIHRICVTLIQESRILQTEISTKYQRCKINFSLLT